MDDQRFDALTRALARGSSRRTALKGLFGGLVGGAALTTRLDRAGAQDDCDCVEMPCKTLSCKGGQCSYEDLCIDACTVCNPDTGACDPKTCDPCYECSRGVCLNTCESGYCCDGTCNAECCVPDDCDPAFEYFCGVRICDDGICSSVWGCTTEQQCCNSGTPDHYCATCCDSTDCQSCQTCIDGTCQNDECCTSEDCTEQPCGSCFAGACEYNECCYPDHPCSTACHICSTSGCINTCKVDEECCGESCVPIGTCCRDSGETCAVTDGPGTQGNCCEDLLCCPGDEGGYCAECCNDDDCPGCSYCNLGVCSDECVEGRRCCDGDCIPNDECCSVDPACPPNHFCCGQGEAGAHCAFCCEDSQCDGGFSYCENGHCEDGECFVDSDCGICQTCIGHTCFTLVCLEGYICCGGDECVPEDECCQGERDYCDLLPGASAGGDAESNCCADLVCCDKWDYMGPICAECCDDSDCGACETCNYGYCAPVTGCCKDVGESCGEIVPTSDGADQYDCCDGLVCCFGQATNICAQCCSDADCGHGGTCDDWVCTYPSVCHKDTDCPEHTCCCDDGSCSWHCCDHHHPHPHPHPKPPKPTPDTPVTTLPATGSGAEQSGSGLLGAAALGAAALLAAKKLRDQQATGLGGSPIEE